MNLENRFSKNGEVAFMQIYETFHNSIYHFMLRYVISPSQAQDLTHDVFVKIWEKRDCFHKIVNVRAYIFRMARNQALDYLKRISLSNEAVEEVLRHYKIRKRVVEDELLEKEYFEFLELVIRRMCARSQQIFTLCRQEKKTYQEVAAMLGISRETVKHHMMESMKTIKKRFTERFDLQDTWILFLVYSFLAM